MKYRKKPIEVQAFRLGHDEVPMWARRPHVHILESGTSSAAIVHTREGDMCCSHGDWIRKGIRGELYPCKAEIFTENYEAIE